MGVYLMGVHLIGVYLMGVYFMGVHLMGMYLIDVYLIALRRRHHQTQSHILNDCGSTRRMYLCEAALTTGEQTSAKSTTIGTGLQTACWLPSRTTAVGLKAEFCIGLAQPSTSGAALAIVGWRSYGAHLSHCHCHW